MIKEIIKKENNIKLNRKKRLKKETFSRNFTKKLCIIFMLIISYMSSYKSDKNIIHLEQYQASVLPEIKSYEKNISLNQEIFYEFRKINSENKLLEENPNFKESSNPDVSIILTMYNQAHCIHKGLRSIQNQY